MMKDSLHTTATAYIDGALAIHEAAGEPATVSAETYDAAVKAAEDAFRELCEVRERKIPTAA